VNTFIYLLIVQRGLYIVKRISYECGSDINSPLNCNGVTFQSIFSSGEDLHGNLYFLTDQGVFQIVDNNRCGNIICNTTCKDFFLLF